MIVPVGGYVVFMRTTAFGNEIGVVFGDRCVFVGTQGRKKSAFPRWANMIPERWVARDVVYSSNRYATATSSSPA